MLASITNSLMEADSDNTVAIARTANLVRMILDEIGFDEAFLLDVSDTFVEAYRGDILMNKIPKLNVL